ncbi:MAG: leucyl/phenylalanyl-tRNA--protein transferase [Deltaproteobacteria bacterium]|nr:leucyl/phenylalanyl-tRNA--protein transferase [Deltaproteobacteria bacterium]
MPVIWLGKRLIFPPPGAALPSGLLAAGGDLSPDRLLLAYASGIFPWYSEGDPILWFSPDPRMVLLPSQLRVSRSLRKFARRARLELRMDTAFEAVIRACAGAKRPGGEGTWITKDMIRAYSRLHEMGYAHSAEAWVEGRLAAGVYGVSLGGAFFAESMFTRLPNASKTALVALVRQVHAWNFDFVDCQVHTENLARFGATEWPRGRFLGALDRTLRRPTLRGRWSFERDVLEALREPAPEGTKPG